jgi:hypothetical protein
MGNSDLHIKPVQHDAVRGKDVLSWWRCPGVQIPAIGPPNGTTSLYGGDAEVFLCRCGDSVANGRGKS